MIQVLIVDDSPVFRSWLKKELSKSADIEVSATAGDAYEAFETLKHTPPDVIILDIEMPRMNGLTFLRKLMLHHPIPTGIVSSLTQGGCQLALECLEAGALEVFAKPGPGNPAQELSRAITTMIRAASGLQLKQRSAVSRPLDSTPLASRSVLANKLARRDQPTSSSKVIACGSSTGGTEALRKIFAHLDACTPGMVLVQHMPKLFTGGLAKGLDAISPMTVREAKNGDRIQTGVALLAPGEEQLTLASDARGFYVRVQAGPRVNHHCPSVEVLFSSTAQVVGRQAMGVMLTGMGTDGAEGMLEMRKAGAYTIAQDEASCVVFGMPRAVLENGAAQVAVPLEMVAKHIAAFHHNQHHKAA